MRGAQVRASMDGVGYITSRLKMLGDLQKIKKMARPSVLKAARPMRKELRKKYKKIDRLQTENKIYVNVDISPRKAFKNSVGYRVGVTGGAKKGNKPALGGDTYYWRFLEFGTKKRNRIRARRYARTTFLSHVKSSEKIFADDFENRLKGVTKW